MRINHTGASRLHRRTAGIGLILFMLVTSCLFSSGTLAAQQPAVENWLGILDVGVVKLRIQLNLTKGATVNTPATWSVLIKRPLESRWIA